jgi:hypothetical protein
MNTKIAVPFVVLLLVASFSFAQPSGPFTSDADTYLLLHLDGDTLDSGPNGLNCAFSDATADPEPGFVSSMSGFGQCLNNPNSTAVEGIVCASKEISDVTGVFTYEAWINIPPVGSLPANHNFCIIDRGAGRCLYRLYFNPDGMNVTHYLTVFDAASTNQVAYAVTDTTSGLWSYDTWHHIAVTYDTSKTGEYGTPGQNPPAEFFIDGTRLVTYAGGNPAVNDYEFQPWEAVMCGRPWPPQGPTQILMPLVGYIDELRFSTVDRYAGLSVEQWESY